MEQPSWGVDGDKEGHEGHGCPGEPLTAFNSYPGCCRPVGERDAGPAPVMSPLTQEESAPALIPGLLILLQPTLEAARDEHFLLADPVERLHPSS